MFHLETNNRYLINKSSVNRFRMYQRNKHLHVMRSSRLIKIVLFRFESRNNIRNVNNNLQLLLNEHYLLG